MDINFTGKTALVTGAGKGIGREIAKLLAKCGANVVALTRTQSDLDSLKTEIPNLQSICVDLTNLDEVIEAVKKIGTIEYLVNNVSLLINKTCLEATKQDFDSTNLMCITIPAQLMQVVARKLIAEGEGGAIVNISTSGTRSGKYAVFPKAALESLSRWFAVHLAQHKIRVNCVLPGLISTPIVHRSAVEVPRVSGIIKDLMENIPLKRMGEAEEVANTVVYLLSDKGSYMTGESVTVDGGLDAF